MQTTARSEEPKTNVLLYGTVKGILEKLPCVTIELIEAERG